MNKINVKMLGEFVIEYNGASVSDSSNRSKKVWSLLAYLIYNRQRAVKPQELIELLWGNDISTENPAGALKTLLFRARAELDNLYKGAGKDLIIFKNEGYLWSDAFDTELDCEVFDRLVMEINENEEARLECTLKLLSLYRGTFLEKFSSEFWAMPIVTHYHNTYLETVSKNIPLLSENGYYKEIEKFCVLATEADPFNEELHRIYMQNCVEQDNKKKALTIYRELSNRLLSELGVFPSEETRQLYHKLIQTTNEHILSAQMLMEQLKEDGNLPGALICEYDFFRVLYYSMARSVLRNGIAVHIALFTVSGKKGAALSAKKIEKEMEGLRTAVRTSLRRGDSAARCSVSQYVVMLPGANYENSCMVCERISRAFTQRYGSIDATVRFEVQPIEADYSEKIPFIPNDWN